MAQPIAAAHALREAGHFIQHGVYLGHHILPIHNDRLITRRTQRGMQHRAIFGDIDLLAAEHRGSLLAQTTRLGQLHQQAQGWSVTTIFRIIEVQLTPSDGQSLAAPRVVGEQVRAQVNIFDLVEMLSKRPPGG